MPHLRDIRLFLALFRFSELPLLETVESHSLHGHHAMQCERVLSKLNTPTTCRDDVERELRDIWAQRYFFIRD